MANFGVRIDSHGFAKRGVHAKFNEDKFEELLNTLVNHVSVESTPLVVLTPAPTWGMNNGRLLLTALARDETLYPQCSYKSTTRILEIQASGDEKVDNRMLLRATRGWSGNITGEEAKATARRRERKPISQVIACAPIAACALGGLEIGNDQGAVIGGILGGLIGMTGNIIDTQQSPYNQTIRQFEKNPDIFAKYGSIIKYEAVASPAV